jgi:hypothetical protein
MGVAAYNRGTKAIISAIARDAPAPDTVLLRDLTTTSRAHEGANLFAPTVIRFGPHAGEFSLMNSQDHGWAAYSYSHRSLWSIARAYRIAFIGFGRDRHSSFISVEPLGRA